MVMPWHRAQFQALIGRRERLPHALLVRGPEGIGKTAFADALAQALLCERPAADGGACGACPACGWFRQGSHPDFRPVEPEEPEKTDEAGEGRDKKASLQIGVDQVRALADFINLTSHRGGARVVKVRPAEAMNVHAANALLKGLEEPPPQTYFLLVAHRFHQLLPTIRSRCQQIVLTPPQEKPALEWLKGENVQDPGLALAHAGGAPLLAAALDEEYWGARDRLLALLGDAGFDPLAAADRLQDVPPARVVALLQKWSFDLALQQAAGRVRYNPDHAPALVKLAARIDNIELLRFHRRMVLLQRNVNHPLNARLFLEEQFLDYARLVRAGAPRRAA
jgi:DNA polymerase-3 subunit delta'